MPRRSARSCADPVALVRTARNLLHEAERNLLSVDHHLFRVAQHLAHARELVSLANRTLAEAAQDGDPSARADALRGLAEATDDLRDAELIAAEAAELKRQTRRRRDFAERALREALSLAEAPPTTPAN